MYLSRRHVMITTFTIHHSWMGLCSEGPNTSGGGDVSWSELDNYTSS